MIETFINQVGYRNLQIRKMPHVSGGKRDASRERDTRDLRVAHGLVIEAIVWALSHAIGLIQRNPSNRAKSPSVEHNVSPCSTANVARWPT